MLVNSAVREPLIARCVVCWGLNKLTGRYDRCNKKRPLTMHESAIVESNKYVYSQAHSSHTVS